jgi:hypothetical protein
MGISNKIRIANEVAAYAGIKVKSASDLIAAALKASHKGTFKMFNAGEVDLVKLSTKPFPKEGWHVDFGVHKIDIEPLSKSVLNFNVRAAPKQITIMGFAPDLLSSSEKHKWQIHKLSSGLLIYCGLPGDPDVPLPEPEVPLPRPHKEEKSGKKS